jgi:hypothetical protein
MVSAADIRLYIMLSNGIMIWKGRIRHLNIISHTIPKSSGGVGGGCSEKAGKIEVRIFSLYCGI